MSSEQPTQAAAAAPKPSLAASFDTFVKEGDWRTPLHLATKAFSASDLAGAERLARKTLEKGAALALPSIPRIELWLLAARSTGDEKRRKKDVEKAKRLCGALLGSWRWERDGGEVAERAGELLREARRLLGEEEEG